MWESENEHFVGDFLQFWHFDNFEKSRFCSFPHRYCEAFEKSETQDYTCGSLKTSISCETSSNFDMSTTSNSQGFVASPIDTAKPDTFSKTFPSEGFAASPIDTARLSAEFQQMSQNATPATQFALCHHFARPCQCDFRQTRYTTRLKCCACHEKWNWTRPKCCACHEKCNACSENVAKVLRLPRKTISHTSPDTSTCHEVPRLPRETKLCDT